MRTSTRTATRTPTRTPARPLIRPLQNAHTYSFNIQFTMSWIQLRYPAVLSVSSIDRLLLGYFLLLCYV